MAARHLRAHDHGGVREIGEIVVPGEAWGTPRGVGFDEERNVLIKVLESLGAVGTGGDDGVDEEER